MLGHPQSIPVARIAALFSVTLLAWFASPASAMSFSTLTLPDGMRIVLAQGPVAEGDVDRLRTALASADRDPFGNKVVALDSPGGLVIEAFAMVDVMDRERVSTLVRPGAACASACAQILFLSGVHRAVEGSGRIGLHACRVAGERSRSAACNELIAQNALARGTPYASIMAFLLLTEPTEIRWLTAPEADQWGFTHTPLRDDQRPRAIRAGGS